jgi:hypothetical protein
MGKILPEEMWMTHRWDLMRVALLAILATLVWCTIYDRWTVESWQTPLTYPSVPEKEDVLIHLAWIKAAGDGHISPFLFNNVPELGAPYIANWDDFPLTEKPLIVLTGWLARVIGLFAAANFALLLTQVLATISFYTAARLLGGAWLWSFAGGMIFAFSRYAFAQGLHHLTITYYWHVPLGLVVVFWMMRGKGIAFGTGRFWFALLVAFVTGVQNIYYTNMFAQLVLIGGLLQGWRHGWKAALPAVSIVATGAAAFLLMNVNTFAYALAYGGNSGAVARNYQWLEFYGLKLVDLVIPPPDHSFPPFAEWGAAHLKEIILSPGELPPSGYLGILGLGALTWLVIHSWRCVAGGRTLPLEAWLILWIIIYAEVGGINGIIGTLGFQLFRATTRYSIFILCIVLMFAIQRLSLVQFRKPFLVYGAALVGTLFALWDQTPPVVTADNLKETAQAVASDQEFTEQMEKRLPAQAMVFQIPVMDFPESPATGVGAYDHFRPYLYAHDLRFSFGTDKGRFTDKWQHGIPQLPLGDVVNQLEAYGFSAVYVNLNGFPDKGAKLINGFKAAGRDDMFYSDRGDLLCVLLKPSAYPALPPTN